MYTNRVFRARFYWGVVIKYLNQYLCNLTTPYVLCPWTPYMLPCFKYLALISLKRVSIKLCYISVTNFLYEVFPITVHSAPPYIICLLGCSWFFQQIHGCNKSWYVGLEISVIFLEKSVVYLEKLIILVTGNVGGFEEKSVTKRIERSA